MKTTGQIISENIDQLLKQQANAGFNQHDRFDSLVEQEFAWAMRQNLADDVRLVTQLPAPATWHRFSIDCGILTASGVPLIGIEIDGKEFHDYRRDLERDFKILGAGVVPKIYRIRARDVVFRLHDTLHLLALLEPFLFSKRGQRNLETLACRIGERRDFHNGDEVCRRYLPSEENYDPEVDYQPTFFSWRTAESIGCAA